MICFTYKIYFSVWSYNLVEHNDVVFVISHIGIFICSIISWDTTILYLYMVDLWYLISYLFGFIISWDTKLLCLYELCLWYLISRHLIVGSHDLVGHNDGVSTWSVFVISYIKMFICLTLQFRDVVFTHECLSIWSNNLMGHNDVAFAWDVFMISHIEMFICLTLTQNNVVFTLLISHFK